MPPVGTPLSASGHEVKGIYEIPQEDGGPTFSVLSIMGAKSLNLSSYVLVWAAIDVVLVSKRLVIRMTIPVDVIQPEKVTLVNNNASRGISADYHPADTIQVWIEHVLLRRRSEFDYQRQLVEVADLMPHDGLHEGRMRAQVPLKIGLSAFPDTHLQHFFTYMLKSPDICSVRISYLSQLKLVQSTRPVSKNERPRSAFVLS